MTNEKSEKPKTEFRKSVNDWCHTCTHGPAPNRHCKICFIVDLDDTDTPIGEPSEYRER